VNKSASGSVSTLVARCDSKAENRIGRIGTLRVRVTLGRPVHELPSDLRHRLVRQQASTERINVLPSQRGEFRKRSPSVPSGRTAKSLGGETAE
jgi:hypothetical protein